MKHAFDNIMYIHNTAIQNRVLKITKLSTKRTFIEIYKFIPGN